MDKEEGFKMSTLVHWRGEGVKIGQNLVHVVVECPQSLSDDAKTKMSAPFQDNNDKKFCMPQVFRRL